MQKFNKKTNDELAKVPALGEDDETWAIILRYCRCKGLVPSKFFFYCLLFILFSYNNQCSPKDKECFFNGKCDDFKICL